MCVLVKDLGIGKGKILRAVLDAGYTKSNTLKKFTLPKMWTRLKEKDCCWYKTYTCYFTSSSVASIVFRLVEFNKSKGLIINYMFQVDKLNKSKDSKYNMIIGSNILHDLNILHQREN